MDDCDKLSLESQADPNEKDHEKVKLAKRLLDLGSWLGHQDSVQLKRT